MKLSDIVIGTRLELEIFDELGDRISPSFVSDFERFDSKDTAYISAPIRESVVYPVHVGAQMNVFFLGNGDLHAFSAKVIDRGKIGNISVLKILCRNEIEKVQRRQFFRFECSIPLIYRKHPAALTKKTQSETMKGVTRDISGGGIRMVTTDENLKTGDNLEIDLFLNEHNVIRFLGKVVRVTKLENDITYKTELGVRFFKIENKDRETIIRFIFKQQRNLRIKGLI